MRYPSRAFRHSGIIVGTVLVSILVLCAIFAPLISPYDPMKQDLRHRRASPSLSHLFGTDIFGRDVLSRITWGARVSLQVGLVSVALGLLLGGTVGIWAGFQGGWFDNILMRLMDVLLAFPSLILAMVVVSALGPNLFNAMLALGVWFTPNYARLTRSTAIELAKLEYIEASRALGCSKLRLVLRHMIPNTLPILVVYSTLNIGTALLLEATLSFLGLGIQPPQPSWGSMINEGRHFLQMSPHLVTIPGIVIMIAVIGFNSLGEGLRDILDPRSGIKVK
jgi:peptide/nickel transport system permease protein